MHTRCSFTVSTSLAWFVEEEKIILSVGWRSFPLSYCWGGRVSFFDFLARSIDWFGTIVVSLSLWSARLITELLTIKIIGPIPPTIVVMGTAESSGGHGDCLLLPATVEEREYTTKPSKYYDEIIIVVVVVASLGGSSARTTTATSTGWWWWCAELDLMIIWTNGEGISIFPAGVWECECVSL